MSKKHRRNRHQESAESVVQTKPLLVENESHVELSNNPDRSKVKGWLSDLKRNWLMVLIIGLVSLGVLGSGLSYLEKSAQEEIAKRHAKRNLNEKEDSSIFNRLNPFLPAPTPSPTPQLSKSYIYAGSRLLAVEDANATAVPPADLAVWRASTGYWWVMGGQGSQQFSSGWGTSGDVAVQGDYDGDGKTDLAVFRPSTNVWWIIKSSDGSSYNVTFGSSGDQIAPADFDGDGKTDIAVYRSSNTTWYILQSSTSNTVSTQFGGSADVPTPADFDGDGKADVAVWRDSNTTFYSANSSNGNTQTTSYGSAGDKPVCGDYDGDGKADIAVWRSSNATWYILQSTNNQTVSHQYGIGTDTPVQNDYDADGKVDVAVWRAVESSQGAGDVGRWYIKQSTNNTTRQETWGIAGDIPVPAYYRRQ